MADLSADIIRRISQVEQRLDDLIKPEIALDLIPPFLALPGLRALYLGSIGTAGQWLDISGSGMDLTRNGNPTHRLRADYISAWTYDGAGDYHSHADNAVFDILGDEAYIAAASRGLTIYAVVRFDNAVPAANEYIVAKDAGGGQSSYLLIKRSADQKIRFSVYDGAFTDVDSASAVTSTTQWQILTAVWFPSVSLSVWVNGTETEDVAAIPGAPLTNSNANFTIAAESAGGNELDGLISAVAVYVEAHSDDVVKLVYESIRRVYGV